MLYALDLIGTAVFAVSGALAAGRKHLDWIGVLVFATVTATGGGTLRDVLLDRHPIRWLADPAYLAVIVGAAFSTILYVRWRLPQGPTRRALQLADALGLALFSIGGAGIAQAAGLPAPAVVVLGTMTGSAGGVLRDVLRAEVPLLLRRGDLYATAAIAGIAGYLGLEALGVPRTPASFVGMGVVAAVRIAAILYRLQLPVFRLHDEA